MAAVNLSRQPRRAWQALRRAAGALVQPQISTAARERRDLLVLLLAVALVVLPHFDHLPWWAASLLALLWLWRLWLTLAQQPLPHQFAMLPLLLAAAGAVWIQHGTLVGREAGVTFLLLLMALKLLEMRARRDVFVVIFLCFFILLTQFLFSQGLPIAVLTLLAVVLLFFVLVSVNLVEADLPAGRKLRLVGLVLAKAVPLAAAMFVLFPRVSGPLWGLPGDASGGRSGLSDSMTPGSISRLLESNDIAFRVRFEGTPPPSEERYWRGPVFGHFGGRTWAPLRDRTAPVPSLEIRADARSAIDYTVTLEPSDREWLFALEMPAVDRVDGVGARFGADAQLLTTIALNERVRYGVRSYTRYSVGLNETPQSLREWTQLPAGFNPRTTEFAQALRRTNPQADGNEKLVVAVLDHLRRGSFTYTLAPPLLGRHSIDEFLFDTREGFCEHFSSAFVVLMRALDVPARVVTGYQGGDLNPVDDFMTVRQSDAHAWAEVWLAGRGWVRIDPTAAVAPVRIERGAAEIARQQGFVPRAFDVANFGLLRSLRFNWEALQNAWNQWVLSYSSERQRALLSWLGFDPDWRTLGWLFAVTLAVVMGVLAVFSLRHRVDRDPLAKMYHRFCARLVAAGLRVPEHEGPRALWVRLQRELDPGSRTQASDILRAFEQWRYSRFSVAMPPRALRQLRRSVRAFRARAA